MTFFIGPDVWQSITLAARNCAVPAQVAVAYFANEGPKLLPLRTGSTLVVDASLETVGAGSTSPAALRVMLRRGVRIFSAQNLHAKVFVLGARAFVGSANASRNSARYLAEAVVQVDDAVAVAAARAFVLDLAITALDDAALIALEAIYRPPRPPRLPVRQARFTTLVMELKAEQGGRRQTQVQPPKPVWEHYFGVAFGPGPHRPLRLIHAGGLGPASGHISGHDHNLTIELPGAGPPFPALLEVRKTGPNTYVYEVHRAGPDFARLTRLLASRGNPFWTKGRKWLIV